MIFTWIVFLKQTDKDNPKHWRKIDEHELNKVSDTFPFLKALLRQTIPDIQKAHRPVPQPASDEQSTQKVQVHEYEIKIKLHKTFCDYIYNCRFLFLFFLVWGYDTPKQSILIRLLCLN